MTDNPTRPLADLIADLRDRFSGGGSWGELYREAADVLALVAEHLPPPVCDTCGGSGRVLTPRASVDYVGCPAPFCDHGRVALPEHLRRVGALWTAVQTAPLIGNPAHDGLLTHLRQVGAP